MTPLLPTPKHYLYNLITMTSPDAKKLWRRAVKEHFNCTCVYCGNHYEINQLTLDHVKPKCNGGETITKNMVPACRRCNQEKGSRYWRDWMRDTFGYKPYREEQILSHIN